jgi:flagellar L-ring protein precursor FlgH
MPRTSVFKLAMGLAALLGLQACSTTQPAALNTNPNFAPVYAKPEPKKMPTGAIYNGRASDSWFGRGRSYQVGDVITVLLNESTQAAKQQSADLKRESSNDAIPTGIQSLPGGVFKGLKLDGASMASSGTGSTGQSASLTGDVSVSVVEVYNNGNLLVRGEKQLALTEGVEVIQVSGIIRPEDISRSNTVQSRRLANAQIAYRGTGDVANASKPGWGTSLLLKLWPF